MGITITLAYPDTLDEKGEETGQLNCIGPVDPRGL